MEKMFALFPLEKWEAGEGIVNLNVILTTPENYEMNMKVLRQAGT